MFKTTVYLDEISYLRLKQIARRKGKPPAAALREAVSEYAARHWRGGVPRSIGKFRSGRRDLGSRAEDLLGGLGEER
jgi:hypothetical protein